MGVLRSKFGPVPDKMLKDNSSQNRFEEAVRRFDEENSRDPNTVEASGVKKPRELVYAEWLTDWVLRRCPAASEELRLAARCQHLCRWNSSGEGGPLKVLFIIYFCTNPSNQYIPALA